MKIVDRPSPNHDARKPGQPIDILVLHYTGMPTGEEALARLCDPQAKVSAHYTVDEDGTVFRHVGEARRAWHAGVSAWAGDRDVNGRSIGIEIVNPGHEFGYRPFPEAQMAAVTALCRTVLARHPIPAWRVLGHSDVAPSRKQDPGELFDWARLAGAGVGLWPDPPRVNHAERAGPLAFQRDLTRFGYDCPESGAIDEETAAVVAAFQRHFRPARIDGRPDAECHAVLRALLSAMGDEARHEE